MVSTSSAMNPHEKMLRQFMSKKSVIHDFFHKHFPAELLNEIAMDSVQQEKVAFDHDLAKESTVEFVYKAEWLDQEGYVYFIVVFHSGEDWLISFRMEKFIHSVMDHDLKTSGLKKLPLVFAVVLNHGPKPEELRIPKDYCKDLH